MRVSLSTIVLDAGTQIRASIDPAIVRDYAEQMTRGAVFPPVVLFHDGSRYYMADGFHRLQAWALTGADAVDAAIQVGTLDDAIWFALGANRTNGQRMTERDASNAVAIALRRWPDKVQREIADHVGCHPSLVSTVYQRLRASESVLCGRDLATSRKRERVRALLRDGGKDGITIAREAKCSASTVSDVRAEMGLSKSDNSKAAIKQRRTAVREMADAGYTSRQIASEVGLSIETIGRIVKDEGIDVRADQNVPKRLKRHDANRIVERMAFDAEHLCADVNLIEFDTLDPAQLPSWLLALERARDQLGVFIRRLREVRRNEVAS